MKSLRIGLGVWLLVSLLDIHPAFSNAQKLIDRLSPKVESLDRKELMNLGKAYSQVGNHNAAIKIFTAALAKNSKDIEAKTHIGAELLKLKNDTEALEVLKEALTWNKKYVPAYRQLIKYYNDKDNKYELRLIYQDMVQHLGERTEFLTELCYLTTMDGLYDLSARYCQQSMVKDPKNPRNHVYWGLTLHQTGKAEEAKRVLKRSADQFKKSYLAQFTWAQQLEEQKNFVEAYNYFKAAVAADNKNSAGHLGLAQSAFEIQKYEEALNAFQSACALDRGTLPHVRKATNSLRNMREENWAKRYDQQSDRCGISN